MLYFMEEVWRLITVGLWELLCEAETESHLGEDGNYEMYFLDNSFVIFFFIF